MVSVISRRPGLAFEALDLPEIHDIVDSHG